MKGYVVECPFPMQLFEKSLKPVNSAKCCLDLDHTYYSIL